MIPNGLLLGIGLILLVVLVAAGMARAAIKSTAAWRRTHADRPEERDLARFGYAQQLLRDMGGFSNFAISFSVISVLTGGITLYGYGLTNAGPAVMGLGWPLVTFFVLFVAASMAELASAIPTAGALYHWSSLLGGSGWGWFTAFLNLIGLVATIAGIDYGCAQFLTPLLGLNDKNAWIVLAVCGAILLMHAALNHRGIRLVARLNDLSAGYHIVGVLAIVIALAIFGPKQPIEYMFTKTYSTLAGHPYSYAFLVALLQAQWTYTGYDASAHTSEETRHARLHAPWGVYLSVAVSAVAGFAMLAMVTLAIKDLPAAAGDSNPFVYIVKGALGGVAGSACLWLVTIAMWFCGLACVTSTSRMIFAFARDGGLPGSKKLRTVDRHGSPSAAVWLASILAFALPALITALVALNPKGDKNPHGLDFAALYPAVTGIGVIGLYLSYGLPVILRLRAMRSGRWAQIGDGPWSLGRWSQPVAIVAIAWIAFITVLFVLPPNELSGYIFAGCMAAAVVWYLASVRGRFTGPEVEEPAGSSIVEDPVAV
ncbi:amino acid permease [Fimbriimonas ginsengisoli]|uniref:Amino acid transporter n=1 Tax=Fimbriimonas ginsengisoli Gsoil 348 TaxID=661478 RepID=A0A068NWP6_FIMGI|nr:amino acid permease [Fimbriimonas ginsengisoli]AIE87943.1 amino acid transporter [Fimbriimonas ginsengisoli Gsoil 348]